MLNFQTQSQDPTYDDLERRFRRGLREFCELLGRMDITLEPCNPEVWVKFRSLPTQSRYDAFNRFSSMHTLCVAATKNGIDVADHRSLTWWFFKDFGLRPCSDFFALHDDDDVLEVFGLDHRQIYRNWAYFKYCGYTLGDLFVHSWMDLYLRDESVTRSLLAQAEAVFHGGQRKTVRCETDAHVVVESMSKPRLRLKLGIKYLSPLYNADGDVMALAVTSRVEHLDRQVAEESAPVLEQRPRLHLV